MQHPKLGLHCVSGALRQRGPARRCPSARSRTARTCRPARQGLPSPPRRALPASLLAASRKSSCAGPRGSAAPRAAPQVQHDGAIRPRASPGAAVRGLRDLLSLSRPTCHSFFTGPVFFGGPRILPGSTCPSRLGRIAFFARFCATKCYSSRPYVYIRTGRIARFARFLAWHLLDFCMAFFVNAERAHAVMPQPMILKQECLRGLPFKHG